MDLRLIAFDLDGTLLRSDKSISPRTMHALHAAQERGVLLVPATGRLYRSLPEALLDEQLSRYFILVNGAQVYDAQEDKTLLTEELPPELALPMLQFLKTRNVVRGVYIDGLGHMSREDYAAIHNVARTFATETLLRRSVAAADAPPSIGQPFFATQITCIYQLLRLILQPQHHSFLPSSTPAAVPHASAREPLCDDTPQTAAAVLRDAISFLFSFGYRLS